MIIYSRCTSISYFKYEDIISISGRSQWLRGLRHELTSPALESSVRIPLEAWMCVCVYSVFVLSSVQVELPCNGLIPRPRSPTFCVKRLKDWKSGQGPTKGCRNIDRYSYPVTRSRVVDWDYTTDRKVAVSIPYEIIWFFNWPNPPSRNMAWDWLSL
jgi:hypothetical protein